MSAVLSFLFVTLCLGYAAPFNVFDPANMWTPVDPATDQILPKVLNFSMFEINKDLNGPNLFAVSRVEDAKRAKTFSLRNFLPLNHKLKLFLQETSCTKNLMAMPGFDFKSCQFAQNAAGLECDLSVRYIPPFDPKVDQPRYEMLEKECHQV